MAFFYAFDLPSFIQTIGYLGIFIVVFAESGLLVGLVLPGDSLLFSAGFLASQHLVSIFPVILVCFLGAVLGDSFGYFFGRRVGPRFFKKEESFFFRKSYMERTGSFYAVHGKKTLVLARFLPVVRTFAPILAGVGNMHYPTFLAYNIVGAVLWAIGVPLAGYYLGSAIPGIDHYLVPIIIAIVVASLIPATIEVLRVRRSGRNGL